MICLMDIAPKSHVRVHTILYNNFKLEGIIVSNYGNCIGVEPIGQVTLMAPQIFIIPAEYISLLEILGEESVDTYKVVLSAERGKFRHYLRKQEG